MRNTILYSLILLLSISCNKNKIKEVKQINQSQKIRDLIDEQHISPLIEGEILLNDDAFGDIIELKGESHPVERIFKVIETEMLVKDSLLIVKNINEDYLFMVFSLPDFRYVKSFGRRGNGPGEFISPSIVKTSDTEIIFFIYDYNGKLYYINKKFEVIDSEITFNTQRQLYGANKIYATSSDEFYYVGVAPIAKVIYKYSTTDSVAETSIKPLSIKGFIGWGGYIGDFGVNYKKERMVFAYKYFKKIIFTDLTGQKERVLNFNTSLKIDKKDTRSMLAPSNITHYWGMSAQKDYLYVLYSGRTPIDVTEELKKSSGYIYVEQFDWNGNPICKFKLDHWGYFCVNEEENTIYLASITDEHPFISYKLPID